MPSTSDPTKVAQFTNEAIDYAFGLELQTLFHGLYLNTISPPPSVSHRIMMALGMKAKPLTANEAVTHFNRGFGLLLTIYHTAKVAASARLEETGKG